MEQKKRDLEKLLVAMNKYLEDVGYKCGDPCFDFNNQNNIIIKTLGFDYPYFKNILQIGIKRDFVGWHSLGLGTPDSCKYFLTKEGAKYAISVAQSKETRTKVLEFIKHPLFVAIISAIIGALIGKLM